MSKELKTISCDPLCGFMVRSHSEEELIELAKAHVQKMHPEASYSDDEIRTMIKSA